MKISTDPTLLWIAKQALNLEWPEPSDDLKRLHVGLTGDGSLPKHVKQIPSGERHFIIGMSLSGKYRPLAYAKHSLHAALLADCIVLRVDEFLKRGIRSDAAAQRTALNFPVEYALDALATNESLTTWWGEVLSHIVTENILVESDDARRPLRSGRPKTVSIERFESLEKQIWEVNRKLDLLLDPATRQTTIVTLPDARPGIPADDCIGWPLPASGFVPDVTCSNGQPT